MKLVLSALSAFSLLLGTSVMLYPGGTWFERDSLGYSFLHNYWCDLLSPIALNGQPNSWGSLFARLSFLCFALALVRFWPLALALSGARTRELVAKRAGQAGAAGLVLAALVPPSSSQLLHGVAVVFAVLTSVLAACLFTLSLRARGELVAVLLGAGAALAACVAIALYVYQGLFGGDVPFLPTLQKATTLVLLLWMARILWLGRDGDPRLHRSVQHAGRR